MPAWRSRCAAAGCWPRRRPDPKPDRLLGFSVFIFDGRGCGRSTGQPSEAEPYRDAQTAWDHLTRQRGIAPQRIVLFSESLGGAAAAWLATREQPGALALSSVFTSAPDLAADLYPWQPLTVVTLIVLLLRHRARAAEAAS